MIPEPSARPERSRIDHELFFASALGFTSEDASQEAAE
jgi:hypothetical protein